MNPIGPAEALAYLSLVGAFTWGAARASGEEAPGYFLAGRSLSAWSVGISLFVSELTILVFISVAASAFAGSHTAFQLAVGYAVGRVLLGYTLLAGLFNGTQTTAYQRLHMRFGLFVRWLGASSFWVVRFLRDSAVLWVCAVTYAALTAGTPERSFLTMGLVAAVVVGLGGLRGAVRVDVVHGIVLAGAAIILLGTLAGAGPGWSDALDSAFAAGKLAGVDASLDLTSSATLLVGILGGAAWSAAAYSTDQLTVQRLLATGSLRSARWALIGSAVLLLAATSVMLTTGTMLWATDPVAEGAFADRLTAFLNGPGAAAGAWMAGAVFVSGVSTLTASALSLGSSVAYDVVSPSTDGERHPSVAVGRALTLALGAAVVGAAFWLGGEEGYVGRALSVTTVVYGILLGVLVVASLRRADPMRGSPGSFLVTRLDILIAAGVGAAVAIWLGGPRWAGLPWAAEWRVLVVAVATVGVGLLARTVRKAVHDPTH